MYLPNVDDDLVLFAKSFTGSISGSRYLIFRDYPELIKKYVIGKITLDYGCGPGNSTTFLKSLGLDVEGMDINKYVIHIAREKGLCTAYEVIKSGEIPRHNNFYDLVNASFVLPYASTKQELEAIVQEISRVLKIGGTLIAAVNSEDTFRNQWLSANTDFEENKNLTSGVRIKYFCKISNYLYKNLHYWSEDDYCKAFTKAGLTILCIRKPRGKDSDGWNWINEKEKDFVSIFVACKLRS